VDVPRSAPRWRGGFGGKAAPRLDTPGRCDQGQSEDPDDVEPEPDEPDELAAGVDDELDESFDVEDEDELSDEPLLEDPDDPDDSFEPLDPDERLSVL
jgi:hypothetical protein